MSLKVKFGFSSQKMNGHQGRDYLTVDAIAKSFGKKYDWNHYYPDKVQLARF